MLQTAPSTGFKQTGLEPARLQGSVSFFTAPNPIIAHGFGRIDGRKQNGRQNLFRYQPD
jgi:hypothetical protein